MKKQILFIALIFLFYVPYAQKSNEVRKIDSLISKINHSKTLIVDKKATSYDQIRGDSVSNNVDYYYDSAKKVVKIVAITTSIKNKTRAITTFYFPGQFMKIICQANRTDKKRKKLFLTGTYYYGDGYKVLYVKQVKGIAIHESQILITAPMDLLGLLPKAEKD